MVIVLFLNVESALTNKHFTLSIDVHTVYLLILIICIYIYTCECVCARSSEYGVGVRAGLCSF